MGGGQFLAFQRDCHLRLRLEFVCNIKQSPGNKMSAAPNDCKK